MDFDEFTNQLQKTLNGLIDRNYFSIEITELSNELLGTLKTMRNCVNCKDKIKRKTYFKEFDELINKAENLSAELEKEEQGKDNIIVELNKELLRTDDKLNKEIL